VVSLFITDAFHAVVGLADSGLEGLATLLTPSLGGLAAAGAIVLFTVLVRLLVSPLSWLQARSARRGAALAPQIAELRARHKDDPMALATETLALQRANGAGPGLSLLPGLVQAPFFMVMYRLVQPGAGALAGVLAGAFLGVPLTAHLVAGFPVFAGLLALATALAVWSSARARRQLAPAGSLVGAATKAGSGGPAEVAAGPAIGRLLTYLPYLTVLVVAYLPLAGALYLVTSTAWTALEQALWRRPAVALNP
jgi:YidC/Oxa1 family membrane protein insertase